MPWKGKNTKLDIPWVNLINLANKNFYCHCPLSPKNNRKESEEINVPQGKQDAKVLGLVWNNKDDVLKYKVEVKVSQQSKLTKRNILS